MKGKDLKLRIMSMIVVLAMVFSVLPGNLRLAAAENETNENETNENGYVTDVTGLTEWERVWLTKSVTITENVTITGEVVLEDGAAIYVESGKLYICEGASVTGDIYIEKGGTFGIDGSVYGTVQVNSSISGVQQEDWEGNFVRSNNYESGANSFIEKLILNGVGFGWVDGTINTVNITENHNADYNFSENASVHTLNFSGNSEVSYNGYIRNLYVTGGNGIFYNESRGEIDCVRVSGGQFNNSGTVHYLLIEDKGVVYNNNVEDTAWPQSLIENVVIKESATETYRYGEFRRNFENHGNVSNLLVYGGYVCSLGKIDYLYADGCDLLQIETCSWTRDSKDAYQVGYLFAKDTNLECSDYTDERTRKPIIEEARLENGSLYARDVVVKNLYLDGEFSNIILDRVEVYELYLNQLVLSEQMNVEIQNPNEVILSDFRASAAAKDAYETVTAGIYDQLSEEDQKLLKEFMFEVAELPDSGATVATTTFTETIDQYDIVTITFEATSAIGAVLVESPSGYESLVLSKDDETVKSFIAYESGDYTFRVIGDDYGAKLQVDVTEAAKLAVSVYTKTSHEKPEEVEKVADLLCDYKVTMYDATIGRAFDGFVATGEEIYFKENPKGHTFEMTLTSKTESWQWEDETISFTIKEGETKEVEVILKQFGDFYGHTKDGIVPQVYLYDTEGVFIRPLDTDSNGGFWSGWMPSGQYTVIFLQDDTGSYMFAELSDFEAYGLVEDEDYHKYVLQMEAGRCIYYPKVTVPDAPKVDNPYFDLEVTAFNTNRQTTVAGELIQLTLDYSFKEMFADKVTGLVFHFPLTEGSELELKSVTCNGKVSKDCELENGELVVPANKTTGTITFMISTEETDVVLLTTAIAEFILESKECRQFIGTASTQITALTIHVPSVANGNSIYVTGYTTPYEVVSILDNGEEVTKVLSNSSGYYSTQVKLSKDISTHKICAGKKIGTPNELRTPETIVSKMSYAPELLSFSMYYYVHGHSAEFHFTGDEFQSKRFIYDYWPGSVFTFEIKLDDSSAIDELYVVSNNGSVKSLQAFYEEEEDIWVASGIFSEDENYAPADFSIEYTFKEISVAELGDYDMAEEEVDPKLLEIVYNEAEQTIENARYDEETNTISATVNVASEALGTEYQADVSMSYQKATRTPEDLINQGFSHINLDGLDYYYKHELDLETGKVTMTTVTFLTEVQAQAMEGELFLLGNISDGIGEFTGEFQQMIEVYGEDIVYDWLKNATGNDPAINDLIDMFDEEDYLQQPFEEFYDALEEAEGAFEEIEDWWDTLTGKEANEERQKYFDKLAELERKLDQAQQAQMDGRTKACGMVPLGPFYDDIAASYQAANTLANSKWSFGWIKKVCSSAAGYVVDNGKVKIKGKEYDIADYLEIPEVEELGIEPVDNVIQKLNENISNINELLDVENLYEKGIDWMAGDTLDYWENANAEHLKQLENSIDQLLMSQGIDPNASGDNTSGNATTDNSMVLNPMDDLLEMGGNAGSGDCFPKDVPNPSGEIPGGGGGVNWDPSGYVYEAVPSNRLSGVTTVTYYRDKDDSEVLWNAEEYGQINPQVTDENGRYGWFVPAGDWKVIYTKDGYIQAETEWLPVPPPQTEVNVGMVSMIAPKLTLVSVSPKSVVAVFSKYVTVESVTAETMHLEDAAGTTLNGEITAINAEAGEDGELLASKFRIALAEPAILGSEYQLVIKAGILGYNGLEAEEGTALTTCVVVPESIMAEVEGMVAVGEESEVLVRITADGGFETMQLSCTSNDAFVEVVSVGEIAADGTAKIVVKAKKSGVSALTIGVEGSDMTVQQEIVTARAQDSGLTRYINRENNKLTADTSIEGTLPLGFVFAIITAVAVIVLAGVVVFSVKKRKKTA